MDAIWSGEWGWLRGVLDGGHDRQRGMGNSGVNVGHPVVTNGDSAVQLCEIACINVVLSCGCSVPMAE